MTARLKVQHLSTAELDDHVQLIKDKVSESMRDGETRQLAVQIVSGSYDYTRDRRTGEEVPVIKAWGKLFRAPPGPICVSRDNQCEIERVWDFVVLNVRYVYDPTNIDTFCTTERTLLAGGGDCDDLTVVFDSLLGSLGFHTIGRVISTKEAPNQWVHIYPMVAVDKDDPRQWVPLDATVNGALPGWEFPQIAKTRDYILV